MELKISKLLRCGVLLSGALIAAGWLMGLKFNSNIFKGLTTYEQIPLKNFLIYHHGQGNWSLLLAYAGLGLLILLPLIRVLLTGILFVRQKEYLLSFVALTVLLGLLLSFSFGT